MYFTGIIIALSTFLIIGIFHPIVVKTEYYFGTRFWFVFLILGIISIVGSLAWPTLSGHLCLVCSVLHCFGVSVNCSNRRKG